MVKLPELAAMAGLTSKKDPIATLQDDKIIIDKNRFICYYSPNKIGWGSSHP
jgi:hypothetical protein